MYEEEFEEGLKRLNPKIAEMMRKAHDEAVMNEKMSGDMLIAGMRDVDKKHEEEERKKQEMIEMIDRAVEESKDHGQ